MKETELILSRQAELAWTRRLIQCDCLTNFKLEWASLVGK